jgi:uncharacterized cofD-like protein
VATRVVAIGGGHGLARALAALRLAATAPTAIVTVADDGGSSGRLREQLGVLPPGDLRMALLALARNRPLADALAHRFASGDLEGHALGNLLLVALWERAGGDFVTALAEAGALLDCAGRVLPATLEPVRLHGRVGGADVAGQVRIATAQAPVERVWLDPDTPSACDEAVEAIGEAELVLLGPGSLFTSILAVLAVPGIAKAVSDAPCPVVYVANARTQVGETSGLDLDAHVSALMAHVPGLPLHAVIAHDGPAAALPGEPLAPRLRAHRDIRLVRADLLDRDQQGRPSWGHDPERLAAALAPWLVR